MRFRKSVRIMPGVRLNFSKSGVSTSVGGRGGTVNFSNRGVRSTLSIPGTGLSWSSRSGRSEARSSRPADEMEYLLDAAGKSNDVILKEAEKANVIGDRIDRAIATLNAGRGVTRSKVQTFEKRVLSEEQKLAAIEAFVREKREFLGAIEARLRGMSFGMFSGGKKKLRDDMANSVAGCVRAARDMENQLAAVHREISDKLSEVQDLLDDQESKVRDGP